MGEPSAPPRVSIIDCLRISSMNLGVPIRPLTLAVATLTAVAVLEGCRHKEPVSPPVATPSFSLNHPRAALGSAVEITYKFVVANDAHFSQDYRVMVHVMDTDDELIWTDDHNPPIPTTQWKPGQTVEYTRTVFIPVYPYVGEAAVQMGLYSTADQKRLPLAGEEAGQRAYKVGKIQLLPQTDNIFVVFKDGWHPTEVAEHNATVEWQWTKKSATLAFKNPKKDCVVMLDLDNPGNVLREPQQVKVSFDGKAVDQFTVSPKEQLLRKIPLTAAQLGSADMVELQIDVDKTFVPAMMSGSNNKDPRELGVRVFHAYVDAR
jgi:hypothetical protein